MLHEAIGKQRLIVEQERAAVFSGNIVRGDHDEFVPRYSVLENYAANLTAS
jgi:hypothetical protein